MTYMLLSIGIQAPISTINVSKAPMISLHAGVSTLHGRHGLVDQEHLHWRRGQPPRGSPGAEWRGGCAGGGGRESGGAQDVSRASVGVARTLAGVQEEVITVGVLSTF
jgi:hypothetical protein